MPKPPFARHQSRIRRASRCLLIPRRVWYSPEDDFEYEPDPVPERGTWHRIDYPRGWYQDIDPQDGNPVAGGEGRWRPLD